MDTTTTINDLNDARLALANARSEYHHVATWELQDAYLYARGIVLDAGEDAPLWDDLPAGDNIEATKSLIARARALLPEAVARLRLERARVERETTELKAAIAFE